MKKNAIFTALILVILIFMTSCRMGGSTVKAVKELLNTPVKIVAVVDSNQKNNVEFSLYSYESETIFTFNTPKTLSYLTVKKNSNGYSAQYSGIETKVDEESIKSVDALDYAIATIRESDDSLFTVKSDDDGYDVVFVSIDGNNVLVYYDSTNKNIKKIVSETGNQSFTYQIKEIEKINA